MSSAQSARRVRIHRHHLPRRRWLVGGALAVIVLGTVCAASAATGRVGSRRAHAAGALSFAAPVVYPNNIMPNQVGIGDLNGDGYPDLVVVNPTTFTCVPPGICTASPATVSVLLNNGAGTLRLAPGSPLTITCDPSASAVSGMTRRAPDNRPGSAAACADPTYPSLVVGDFNGDGKLDVAILDIVDMRAYILLGNGDGTLRAPTAATTILFPWPLYPATLAAGDFNHDGKPDLAVADSGGGIQPGSVSILLGHGDGTFAAPSAKPGPGSNAYPTGGRSQPTLVLAGDLNGDGKPDVVTLNYDGFGIGAPPHIHDGPPDSVGIGTASYSVLLGSGSGGLNLVPGAPVTTPDPTMAMAIGDFNGDGRPDLVFANDVNSTLTTSALTILVNAGNGKFSAAATNPPLALPTSPIYDVEVGDFNGDGKPDLVVTNLVGQAMVFLGTGNANFAAPQNFPASTHGWTPFVPAIGDFNADGLADMAVTNYEQFGEASGQSLSQFDMLLNTSTYTLPTSTTLTTGATTVTQGNSITLTATVRPTTVSTGRVGGSVTFKDGGSTLATVKVSGGKASYTTTALALGTHTLTASYGGAGHFTASASRALTLTVGVGGEDVLGGSTSGQPAAGQPATGSGNPGGAAGQANSGTPQKPPAAPPAQATIPTHPTTGSGFPMALAAAIAALVSLVLAGAGVAWRAWPGGRDRA